MKTEMETVAELHAKASWRVAVTQGLTLLGFKEWVIECTNYPLEAREECETVSSPAPAATNSSLC